MPQPPNMQQLLKQAQKMQEDMLAAQEALKDEVVEASAGGGMVTVRVTGALVVKEIRIDPAAQNGTVGVDVMLLGPLPEGARPELSVDGTVEIERLRDVVFVDRPVSGEPDATIGLFKLVDDGSEAVRVSVTLGKSSVNTVEILEGLNVGDKVILSDMSTYDTSDRIRLR